MMNVMLINYDKLKREKEKVRRRWKKKKDIGGSWERVRQKLTFQQTQEQTIKKQQHKVKKQRPGIKHKTKEATNTQKQKPLLCNDVQKTCLNISGKQKQNKKRNAKQNKQKIPEKTTV